MILGKYNQAKTVKFSLVAPDGVDLIIAATFAAGDIKISKDEGAEVNTTNLPTDEGTGYSLVLTAAEMSAARISLYVIDQTATKIWLDIPIEIETYGNASAEHAFDLDTAAETMRGTDNAALASVCTEARLSELAAANLPADIDTLLTRIIGTLAAGTHNPASAAQIAVLSDWINGGRLDLILDIIAADVVNIDGAAMRGTDSAATAANLAIVDTVVDAIKAVTDALPDAGALTTLITHLTDIKGGTFSGATDSLEAIRNRGDAAWVTGAGGTPPQLLQSTTIATLASQTSFTLTAGSADDNAYNNAIAVITDQTTGEQKAVGTVSDYAGSTKTITLAADPAIFTMAVGDTIEIIAALGSAGSAPTAIAIREEIDSNSTQLAAIISDTNAILVDTTDMKPRVVAIQIETLGLQSDDIPGLILGLNDLSAAQVNAEADTALADFFTSPAALVALIWNEVASGYTTNNSFGKIVRQIFEGIVSVEGSVNDAGATTTTFITNLTEATTSHYADLTLVFIDGALKGQAKPILSYNGATKTIILDEALSDTPANGDSFLILTMHVHPVSQIQAGLATEAKQDVIDANVDAVKAKTDPLTYTKANELDSNVQSINDVEITGDGSANPFDV